MYFYFYILPVYIAHFYFGSVPQEEEMTDLLNFLTVTIGIIQGITKV